MHKLRIRSPRDVYVSLLGQLWKHMCACIAVGAGTQCIISQRPASFIKGCQDLQRPKLLLSRASVAPPPWRPSAKRDPYEKHFAPKRLEEPPRQPMWHGGDVQGRGE